MTKKRGFSILVLVFGLVLAGCPTEEEPGGGPDSPPPTSFTDVQRYTLSNGTFTKYTVDGDDEGQPVMGVMEGQIGEEPKEIGPIGSISADGKLTLNLPNSVADNGLWDLPPPYPNGVKGGADYKTSCPQITQAQPRLNHHLSTDFIGFTTAESPYPQISQINAD